MKTTSQIDNLDSALSPTFISDICSIVKKGRLNAYTQVGQIMIETYWNIGRRIVKEEQAGNQRAGYGKQLIEELSARLTHDFGNGFSARYLRAFRKFYMIVPDISIWKSRFPNLTWTHIFRTLRVTDETAARWYLETASKEMWSVRMLDRNIGTQYFERHFRSPILPSENTISETSPSEMIKSPVIAEFLGFKQDDSYSESELETAIISHLQEFIMELGRGFAFVKRQQLVRTGSNDYYIDLVFYNVILKCYVLIDLKVGKITHQDVGQMDMYRRMYDELKRTDGDNPTVGIVLCSETDDDIARYSILNGSEQLFAAKYKTYMPTDEELRKEIMRQKELFLLQHDKPNGVER